VNTVPSGLLVNLLFSICEVSATVDLGILWLHHVAGLAIRYVLKGCFVIIFKGQGTNEEDIELLR
jgi:sorbitol-specific phosphotransferase system component IIC